LKRTPIEYITLDMATIIRDDDCRYYFDPGRITPMSDGDRKSCFLSCAVQFLGSLKVEPVEDSPDGNPTIKACDKLRGGIATEQFWPLYWCDMKYCGLGINGVGDELGNDREYFIAMPIWGMDE